MDAAKLRGKLLNKRVVHLVRLADVIEEGGSMTEAAEALNLTQPSLSIAVREFEELLGFEFIHRTGGASGKKLRQITMTQQGRNAIQVFKGLLAKESEMLASLAVIVGAQDAAQ